MSSIVDPYISENGNLTGLLIEAPSLPGWDSLAALIEHMRFVRDHHRKIDRVAVVTGSTILTIARSGIHWSGKTRADMVAQGNRQTNGG